MNIWKFAPIVLAVAGCSARPDSATGTGIFPYIDISELGALRMFGRDSEAQQAFGGREASIIFSPSRTATDGDRIKMIDGSDGLSCSLSEQEYAPLAAHPNPMPLVQGKFGVFRPGGEVEIKECEVVTIDGPSWERSLESGKFPNVGRLKSALGHEMDS